MLVREDSRPGEDLGRVAVPTQKHDSGNQNTGQKLREDHVERKERTACAKVLGQKELNDQGLGRRPVWPKEQEQSRGEGV